MKDLLPFVCVVLFVAFTTADTVGDSAEEIEKRTAYPTITFPCGGSTLMPNVCRNMRNAIAKGHPTLLQRITDKKAIDKNRRDSGCTKMPKTPGNNCDEYPFASSKQGGKGAETMLVPIRENCKQGGLLGGFYKKNGIKDGDYYNVVV